jgi:hypothetical protein
MGNVEYNARSRRNLLIGGAAGALGLTTALAGPSYSATAATTADPVNPLKVHGSHNFLEFGDPTYSDEARLNLAMDYFVGRREEVTIVVSRSFLISNTITVNTSYISLDFTTGNVDARALTDRPAMIFTGTSSSNYPNNRISVRGLRLLGPGKAATGSTGILFDSTVGVVRGIGFYGLEVSGFGTGLEFANNTFLVSFYNVHVAQCVTGVSMKAGYVNYGENIRFIGGAIGTSTLGVYNANPNGNFHLISTSIDFCVAAAKSDSGGIFLDHPHLEFNETGASSRAAHFVTGAHTSAKIVITGGHLLFHDKPVADYIFETKNAGWGGGIAVNGLSMFNAYTATGYLCGGTGKLKIRDVIVDDGNGTGSGNGAIMPSRQSNLLIDGNFDLTTIVDPYVAIANATTRITSPSLTLRLVSGNLVATRTTTASNVTMTVDVPCVPGMTYASLFTIVGASSGGTLGVIESFVASTATDSLARANSVKDTRRGQSNIACSTIKAALPYTRVNGPTTWDRTAPSWATHFRIRFMFEAVTAGTLTFSELVVTEM